MNNFEVAIYKHNRIRPTYGIFCKESKTFPIIGGRKRDLEKRCIELNKP